MSASQRTKGAAAEVLPGEEWSPYPERPDAYEVSNMGRVRTITRVVHDRIGPRLFKSRIKATCSTRNGYVMVGVTVERGRQVPRLVHRMVLETFVGPQPDRCQACHNNGNKQDNRLANLRWDTVSGNARDREKHGTSLKGAAHPRAKLSAEQVRRIKTESRTLVEFAEEFGVDFSTISDVRRGRTWRHVQ